MSKGVSVTLEQGNLRTFLGPGKVTYIPYAAVWPCSGWQLWTGEREEYKSQHQIW